MLLRALTPAVSLFLIGCAQTSPLRESPVHAARMQQAASTYTQCVSAEAEKHDRNPAGAEDIAVAAHGRCYSTWEAYRDATRANFFHGARTEDEKQLAQDKLEAHLRSFEQETRRALIDSVIQRALPGGR